MDPAVRMRDLLEEIELADQVGLDVVGLGEHHREEFIVSSPAVVLAAAAERTKNIRLSSAVNVLSSDDPVRVFQQFAELDLISGGRAEIMAGRGSFIESFALFGYDLKDYDTLFAEKLELLLAIAQDQHVHWEGTHRAPLTGQGIYPRPVQDPLPVWLAVGGTPESVGRAAVLGMPLALAIIGGLPERFAPLMDLYRAAWAEVGRDAAALRCSVNAHGYIADDNQTAADDLWPYYQFLMNRIARERGFAPTDREGYDRSCEPQGHLLVGDPETVADKLIRQHEYFGYSRYLIQFSTGTMPHDKIMKSIELFGTEVAPLVRAGIAEHPTGDRARPVSP